MRAFYKSTTGATADLCQYIFSNTTRLVVRNPAGRQIIRAEFKTWDAAAAALEALNNYGTWINEITGDTLLTRRV